MNSKLILCLALVLSGGLFGCSTMQQHSNWPVFYDAEKGVTKISISSDPRPLNFYTNEISDWNYDLRIPPAKIQAAKITDLGNLDGTRVVEVRLSVDDVYYTDALMILQEIKLEQFLPVYVQDYNRNTREPTESTVTNEGKKIIVTVGMNYSGSGAFHNEYKIILSTNTLPVIKAVK